MTVRRTFRAQLAEFAQHDDGDYVRWRSGLIEVGMLGAPHIQGVLQDAAQIAVACGAEATLETGRSGWLGSSFQLTMAGTVAQLTPVLTALARVFP